jgi:uncharacterized membrane protein YdfJ with MMPL/SSD domain
VHAFLATPSAAIAVDGGVCERPTNTSRRDIVFAGLTVVVALLGMLALNVGIISAMAIGAAVTVVLTVPAAVTLLPALLGSIHDTPVEEPWSV